MLPYLYHTGKELFGGDKLELSPEERQAGYQKRAMASLADVIGAREAGPHFTEKNATDAQYLQFLVGQQQLPGGSSPDPSILYDMLSNQIGEPVTRDRIQNTLSKGKRPVDPRLALYKGFTTGA